MLLMLAALQGTVAASDTFWLQQLSLLSSGSASATYLLSRASLQAAPQLGQQLRQRRQQRLLLLLLLLLLLQHSCTGCCIV
jgi:hypothetical protein